jgi:dipeptidyl aminopeptidase/acylaminoacyl peptidase
VTLTPLAAEKITTALKEDGHEYLRVRFADDMSCKLDLDHVYDPEQDELEVSHGVAIVFDKRNREQVLGIVIDWEGNGEQGGFRVSKPRGANQIQATTLPEARKGFRTKLARRESANEPLDQPPAKVFQIVQYESPAGKMAAYLTPDPKDGKKRPAIVWITGGDCNTIGDVWSDHPAENDQTAAQFRQAGVVVMFPSLRGGNQNPGVKEGFLGEVDDVIAATEFLRKQPHVDPDRIYLGGHSTGGTLVLLVAASSDKYRAVFSFGPVDEVGGYGPLYVPCDMADPKELEIRSPGRWVNTIRIPTFVFEGTVGGNVGSLRAMAKVSTNTSVRYFPVTGANHFNLLAPVNTLIAGKVLKDIGEKSNLTLTEDELNNLFRR